MGETKQTRAESLFQKGYREMQKESAKDSLKANFSFIKPLERSAKLKNPKANFILGYILCMGFKDIPLDIKKGSKILSKCFESLSNLSTVTHDYQATKFLSEYYRVPLANHVKDDAKVTKLLKLSDDYKEMSFQGENLSFEEPAQNSFAVSAKDEKQQIQNNATYDQLVLAIKELSEDGSYDNKERIESIKRSAKNGNIRAANFLGEIYARGEVVEKDMNTSRLYFEEAEALGSIRAKYMLGVMTLEGSYTRRDIIKGLNRIYQAAKAGLKEAQFYLGKVYYAGEMLDRDVEKAYVYFQAAYSRGEKESEKYLHAIESERKDKIFAHFE